MSGPKKKRQPTEFETALASVQSDTSLTQAERDTLLSFRPAHSLYNAERGITTTPDKRAGHEGFYSHAEPYQPYFVQAYEQLKKEKLAKKEKIKLLTEQPGLTAQTRGQAALSLTGGVDTNALSGYKK